MVASTYGLYRTVLTNIWSDRWFLERSPMAKLVFFRLITAAEINPAGVYEYTPRIVASLIGITEEEVEACIAELSEVDKVQEFGEHIFVKNFYGIQATSRGGAPRFKNSKAEAYLQQEPPEVQTAFFMAYPNLIDEQKSHETKKPTKKKPVDDDAPIFPDEPETALAITPASSLSPKQQQREDLVLALGKVGGMGEREHWLDPEVKRLAQFAQQLMKVGAGPEDVERRAAIYKDNTDWTFTIEALIKHWSAIPDWVENPPMGKETEYKVKKGLAAEMLGR